MTANMFQIKHNYTDKVLYECELPADVVVQFYGLQLGYAACEALKAGTSLAGANLAAMSTDGANLICKYLPRANLAGANLASANMSGSILNGANMAGANLTDTSFAGASLLGADMSGANLTGADFAGASLTNAKFTGAKIKGGVTIQREPLQIFGLGGQNWEITIYDEHMSIGCEFHSLTEWRAYDDRRIIEMDGSAALKFWRTYGATLLAMAASDGRGVEVDTTPASAP